MSDVAKSGELGVGGFFGEDEVEAIDDNAGDDEESDSDEKTGVVVDEDAANVLADEDTADHDADVAEEILDEFATRVDGVAFDDGGEEWVNANDNDGA